MDNPQLKDLFKRMKNELSEAYFKAQSLSIPITEYFTKEHEKNFFDTFKGSESIADGRKSIKPYELITWNNKTKKTK